MSRIERGKNKTSRRNLNENPEDMYNWLFCVLYKHNLEDGKGSARFNGSLIVVVALVCHLGLAISLVKKYMPFVPELIHPTFFNNNKWLFVLFFLIGLFILFKYYNQDRADKLILRKLKAGSRDNTLMDVLKVGTLILVPIGLIILLNWNGEAR